MSGFELRFARFLEDCEDVVSYAKNYFAVHFKLDYVKSDGSVAGYYPDFLVKLADRRVVIVQTKGLVDEDVPQKVRRLKQWCVDVNGKNLGVKYDFVYVNRTSFEKYRPISFQKLFDGFKEFK
jgi:type III restriction enzyme